MAQDPDLLPPRHEAEPEETQSLSEPPVGLPTPSSFLWGWSQMAPTEPVTRRSSRAPQLPEPRSAWLCPSQNHQPEISSFASESPKG